MGFDLSIRVTFEICETTGKPCYYSFTSEEGMKKEYDLSKIIIPEKYRPYFKLRGKFLHAYTDHFNMENIYSRDTHQFLENFPEYAQVFMYMHENGMNDGFWTHEKHFEFYEALEWCSKQDQNYIVEWSY
jgi:hypothetical protein